MKYIDIHAHFESPRFDKDLDQVIARNRQNEILTINSGVNPTTNRKVLAQSKQYPDTLKSSFGLFPIDCIAQDLTLTSEESDLREIEIFDLDEELEWIRQHKDDCVAIGEIGLDYADEEVKNSEELKNKQKENFRKIIQVAKDLNKPIVIHTRKAEADSVQILEESKYDKVILHCFHGNKKLIKQGIENGWSFSIPPNITRLQHFQMMAEMIPLEQLLTETDSPWLSSVAGERNESSNILVTIKEIAKIKNLDEEEVREKILENARRLFNL